MTSHRISKPLSHHWPYLSLLISKIASRQKPWDAGSSDPKHFRSQYPCLPATKRRRALLTCYSPHSTFARASLVALKSSSELSSIVSRISSPRRRRTHALLLHLSQESSQPDVALSIIVPDVLSPPVIRPHDDGCRDLPFCSSSSCSGSISQVKIVVAREARLRSRAC